MATTTNITGYLYDSQGNIVTTGIIYIVLQQDMVSVDATKIAPFSVSIDLSLTGGYVDVDLAPTVGAAPAGLAYKVEFDADPEDTSHPIKNKDGYWRNYWAVPNVASVSLGSFTSALRGQPSNNYQPLGSTVSAFSDTVTLGTTSGTDKYIVAFGEGKIRYNTTTNVWEFSDNGTDYQAFLQGGGGTVAGDLSGTVGAATVIKIRGQAVSPTAPTTTGQLLRWNNSTLQYEPSLDGSQLTNINAGNIGTGTIPLARLSGITNSEISASAAIAWTKLSFAGSSLGHLATRSASDLNSGTIPLARISGLTNVEVAAAAGIAATKIADGSVTNAAFQAVAGLDQTLATSSTPRFARAGFGGPADVAAVAKFVGQSYTPLVDNGNSGSAKTIDWNLGNEHKLLMTDNCTLTLSNPKDGARYLIMAKQGSGGHSFTYPSTVVWPGGVTGGMTAAAGKLDLIVFIYDATENKYYAAINNNY